MRMLLHQSLTDVRRLRWLLGAWLAVIVVRAILVAFPFDARVAGFAATIGVVYLVLSIGHLALLVVIAVMLVHADSAVGTTAFWMTRPLSRGTMAASKALTAVLALVMLPAIATAAAVAVNRLPWADVSRAAVCAALEHLVAVAAAAALAAVTADLAGFALASIALLITFIASLVVTQFAWRPGPLGSPVQSGWLVGLAIVALASVVIFAGQYLWRFRRASLVALAVLAVAFPIHLQAWKIVLPVRPDSLEKGGFDPAQAKLHVVEVGVTKALPAGPREGAGRWITGRLEAALPRQDVVLTPLAASARLQLAGGPPLALEQEDATARRYFHGIPPIERWAAARNALDAAVKPGTFVPPADGARDDRSPLPLMRLDDGEWAKLLASGGTYRADVMLRATAIQPLPVVPLRPGARGRAGDRQLELMDAACTGEGCTVVLRDVGAVFLPDTRRLSRITYVLSNRRLGVALAPASFDDNLLRDWACFPTSEHVVITHRTLRFTMPEGATLATDASWLGDSVLVPVLARDLGVFTRPLVIDDFRSLVQDADAREDQPAGERAFRSASPGQRRPEFRSAKRPSAGEVPTGGSGR